MLITDFQHLDEPDDVMEMFESANLTGGDTYRSNVMMACNWLVGRGKHDEIEEEGEEEEEDELEPFREQAKQMSDSVGQVIDPQLVASHKSDYKIIRVTPANQRISDNFLQMPEMVNLVGVRAEHIDKGAPVFVNTDGLTNPIAIAIRELKERKFPLLLRRFITPSSSDSPIVEDWNPNEMEINPQLIENLPDKLK